MEKTKKVLLCLTTVALLTACNGGNNSTSNSTTSSESNSVTNSESNSPSYDSSSSSSSSSVASKTIRVHMAERPESFIEFDNNQSGKTDNERAKFMELNKDYLVGDDNSVDFKPEMTFIEIGESGIPSETYVDSWNFDITVTNKDTNDKTNIDQYVDSIDKINCLIDFSDKAIDKKLLL